MTPRTTDHPADHVRSRRCLRLPAAVLALASGLAIAQSAAHAERAAQAVPTTDAVQKSLDTLVRSDGFPAALASVRGRDGRVRDYTAGVGDLRTGAKVPVDGYVRIGSNTKTFTAVVLQLVGEGKASAPR